MDGPEKPPAPKDTGKADEPPSRRRDRWWQWLIPFAAVVVPLGLLGGGGYFLWQQRVGALQIAVPYISTTLGWDGGSATVQDFGTDRLHITDLALGSERAITADVVDLRFSLSDLLSRRVGTIQVDGLRLDARLEGGRLVLPLPGGGVGDSDAPLQWPALPFAEAVLNDVVLNIDTPRGPANLTGNGRFQTNKPGSATLELEIAIAGPAGTRGRLRATGRANDADGDAITLSLVFETEAEGFGLSGNGGGSLSATLATDGASEAVFALDDIDLNYPAQGVDVKGLSGNGTVLVEGRNLRQAAVDLDYQNLTAVGQQLAPGRLSLALDDGAIVLQTTAATPWANLALTAEGRIDDAQQPVQFVLRGNSQIAPLIAATAQPFSADGEIAFDIAGAVSDPLGLVQAERIAPLTWLDALILDGQLDLDIRDFALGDNVQGGAMAGELVLDVTPGSIMVQAPRGINLALDRLPIEAPETEIDGLRTALDGPISLILGGDAGTRPMLHAAKGDDGYELTFDTGFNWPELFDGIGGELSAAVSVDPDLKIRSFAMPYLLANLEGVAHAGLAGAAEILLSDVVGRPGAFSGQASAGLRSAGGVLANFRFNEALLEVEGPFRFDGKEFVFSPSEASRAAVADLAGANGLATRERVIIELDGSAHEIRLPIGGEPIFDMTLAPISVGLIFGEDVQEIDVSLGAVTLTGSKGAIEVALADSGIAIPGQPVRIANIVGKGKIDAERRPSAKVSIGNISHTATPAFVVPLQLDATVAATETGDLKLEAEVKDRSGRLNFVLAGAHDRKSGRGEAKVTMKPITFLPTVLQPDTLFPVLQGRTEMVDGDIALTTDIRWGDGALALPADLSVTLRELTTSEIRLENVSAEVHFNQLFPPTTPPEQIIEIGLAAVGVPLTDGRVIFELREGLKIQAQLRELDMFGGLLNSEPFEYVPGMDPFTVVLTANGVELEELLAIAELGEISASGTLDGVLPITLEKGEVAVRGAKLKTGGDGGVLTYKPKDIGPALREAEFSTGLFLQAVENFHYETVEVTLDEGEAEDLVLGLHLQGNNPDLYGGAPFELNVKLEGPLRALLDRGIRTYKLPDRIREQVVDIGR